MKNFLPATVREKLDERRVAKAESQHRSTSAQRHEQFLVDWSWARKPVFVGVGLVWLELTLLLMLRAALVGWQTLQLLGVDGDIGGDDAVGGEISSLIADIELVFVGIFGAWLGLTGTIFTILGSAARRRRRSSSPSSIPEASEEPAPDPSHTSVPAPEGEDDPEPAEDGEEPAENEEVDLDSFDPEIWRVLLAVCNESGDVEPSALVRKLQMPLVRVMYYLEQLAKIEFISDIGYDDEYRFVDTPSGRAYIVEQNLDRPDTDDLPF